MIASKFLRRSFLALALALVSAGVFAQAQPAQKTFEPQVGQDGKDVIWVPTPLSLVEKMLDMAKVTPNDYVIDLGSGDGVTVIAAAKRGARALGIEYNPDMVELSKHNAEKAGVSARAKFVKADLFESDFSQATVITMYLLPNLNIKLRPKILDLKPGTRIVSHAFTMEEWTSDQTDSAENRTAYLWIVPAKVDGKWQLAQGELALVQSFQMFSGTLKSSGKALHIDNGRLRGDQLSFSTGGSEYTGRVDGNSITGTVKTSGKVSAWSAARGGKQATSPKS